MSEDKKVIKNIRARKITIRVNTPLLEDIIKSAMGITLINNSIDSFKNQPDIHELRKHLDPGYTAIACILSSFLNKEIIVNNITGMSVDLLPTAGYCKVSCSYYEEDKKYNYNIVIYPRYGATFINRIMRMPVTSDTKRDELINKFYRTL